MTFWLYLAGMGATLGLWCALHRYDYGRGKPMYVPASLVAALLWPIILPAMIAERIALRLFTGSARDGSPPESP